MDESRWLKFDKIRGSPSFFRRSGDPNLQITAPDLQWMNIFISVPIQLPKMTTFFLQHATLEYDIALLKLDTDINFSGMKRRKTKSPSDLKMWEHAV